MFLGAAHRFLAGLDRGIELVKTMLYPKPGPSWRKARIAARLLLKQAARQPWSARDRALAVRLHADPAVTNRLIDQAYSYYTAQKNGLRLMDRPV